MCRGLARRSYFQMNGNMRAACRVLSRASSIAPSLTVGPAGRLWRARYHVCGGLADEEGLESLERHRAGVQEAGLCSQCSQWRWARAVDRAGVCASVLFRHWSAAVWGALLFPARGPAESPLHARYTPAATSTCGNMAHGNKHGVRPDDHLSKSGTRSLTQPTTAAGASHQCRET